MFGYIIVNRQELKFREFDIYHAYYCGLCRKIRELYGLSAQASLSYDLTFVEMLLTGVYEPENHQQTVRCAPHPVHKHTMIQNCYTDYCAAMNVILAYYHLEDDWKDDHSIRALAWEKLLKGSKNRISADYGRKSALIHDRLNKITACEKRGETNIDVPSGLFGDIMSEVLAPEEDEWEQTLRTMGFYLGKFIYLMDAYDDLEKDAKSGNYNALLLQRSRPDFEQYCHDILTMMMARCCEAFETLPILENAPILRNILYSGVFVRYNAIRARRNADKAAPAAAEGKA